MEGPSEVNESLGNSVEAPQVKRIEKDEHLPRQSEAPKALENAARAIISRSAGDFMDYLHEKGATFDQDSASNKGMRVEELTVSNYKSPRLYNCEESTSNKGLWSNLTRFGDRARDLSSIGDRAHAESSFKQPSSTKRSLGPPQPMPHYSKVAEHLARSDERIASMSMADKHTKGIQKKSSLVSGFARFLAKSSLRGKEVTYKHEGMSVRSSDTSKCKHEGENSQIQGNDVRFTDDAGQRTLVSGGSEPSDKQSGNEEISLREWLLPNRRKLDKVERWRVFRQILKIVDTLHTQGLVLQHLRPSYFLISPSTEVRYVGFSVPKNQTEEFPMQNYQDISYGSEHPLKRKRYSEHGNASLSPKYHSLDQSYKSYMMPVNVVPTSSNQQLIPAFLNLEERCYASPEELSNCELSFSSNIYSLGVLLFELFCYFETSEFHSVAMSDLRYRILPPSFLSECSKEAGFCLWLLHPEQSSRPNSRDILQSDLVSEGQDSLPDQSTASIDEKDAEADLLLHLLLNMKEEKQKKAAKLAADVGCLAADIHQVERRYSLRTESNDASEMPITSNEITERLMENLEQLENAYFSTRSKLELFKSNSATRKDTDVLKIRNRSCQIKEDTDERNESIDPLATFFEGLCKYARYSKFEQCGSLRSADMLSSVNVICSLSFDRDEDYFATAGVSKKIKIFEFGAFLNDSIDIHYPVIEMSSKTKLSCVCWNNYIKNYLASTDYEGVVQLWDASTGQGFIQYAEHRKRAWSADFSVVDPTKLASGSDDCSVKLWSIKERNCIDTIRNVANVCCVQFSPYSSHLLAFGSADYRTYCYDLRFTRTPWCTLAGHKKSVSYVKFLDSGTALSASTDNTLKIWDLNKTTSAGLSSNSCTLTLTGHTNEKNFVGLSVCDGYIACGSETNEVYAYYKTLPLPITSHKFGSNDPITGRETGDDNGQFVSSVCWRSKSNMVVAANSTGSIKLLRMV